MFRARSHLKLYEFLLTVVLVALYGCAPMAMRSQSPSTSDGVVSNVRLVGDYVRPFGLHQIKVEGVGLVTGLAGTGSDPAPSEYRAELADEMRTRGVEHPNQVLASPTTALVLVHGYIRPGQQHYDRFDLEVVLPARSEATSLRGGKLLATRMTEILRPYAGNSELRVHGKLLGIGRGPVLVDLSEGDNLDQASLGRGSIPGGGIVAKSRLLGLQLRRDHFSVRISKQIGKTLNSRFHTFVYGSQKRGVANPKTDGYVELTVHPPYRNNISRYLQIIRSVALRETERQRLARLKLIEAQLRDPVTAATAALRLEAIGKEAVPVLTRALEQQDPELRFYAAEALAYLDEGAAAKPLAQLARARREFRAYALAALGAMDDVAAYEELIKLLSHRSAETRYGAFRALHARNSRDKLVSGENLANQFTFHVLDTSGPKMIHVTKSFRPEIVLFGRDQRFKLPLALEAGKQIMITSRDGREVRVTKIYRANNYIDRPVKKEERICSDKVDEVIRAIVKLGGTYPDVVQFLQQANKSKVLEGRFVVDTVPLGGRIYQRRIQSPNLNLATKRQMTDNPTPASPLREGRSLPGPKIGILASKQVNKAGQP